MNMMIDHTRIRRTRSFAALLLAALLCAPAFAACSNNSAGGEDSLSDIPVTSYTVVRGDSSGSAVLCSVVELKEAIKTQFGVEPISTTDWQADVGNENETSSARHEILVGITNRPESVDANAELEGQYGYLIRSTGNNIVITASTVGLLNEAVKHFNENVLKKAKKGYLPSKIDFKCLKPAPNFLMEYGQRTMNIACPENASPYLKKLVSCFAEMMKELGAEPVISEKNCSEGTLLIGFTGDLQAQPVVSVDPAQFTVRRGEGALVVRAERDDLFSAALASLYEYFADEDHADETIDGAPLFGCRDDFLLEDSWAPSVPRVIGGTYITTDMYSTVGAQILYENVPQTAVDQYAALLTGGLGYIPYTGKSVSSKSFVNADRKSVTLRYDGDEKTLSVAVDELD